MDIYLPFLLQATYLPKRNNCSSVVLLFVTFNM